MAIAIPTVTRLQDQHDVNVTPGAGVDEYALVYDHDTARFVLRTTAGYDHGLLNAGSLADDDHTQYALLAGRAGGQTLYGGTAANEDITIHGTSDATRTTSSVLIQPSGGLVGIGTVSPNPNSGLHMVTQTSTQPRGICIDNYTDTTSAGSIMLRKARGTPGAPLPILVNDGVGAVCFSAWNGVDFGTYTRHAATIQVLAAENWTNGNNGCNMIFTVTPALSEIPFTALTVQYNGAIGIGTGAPQELLHVSSSAAVKTLTECTLSTGYAFKRLKNDTGATFDIGLMGSAKTSTTFGVANAALAAIYYAGNLAIGTTADTPLTLGTNSVARATILGDGKFGIGTSTPAVSLHVKGTTSGVVEIEGTGDTTSAIYLQSNAALKGIVGYSAGNRALQLSHREAGTVFTNYDLVIKEGKVGINTVAPDQQLHVKGATAGVVEIEGTGDTASAIYLQSNLLLKSLVGYSAANDALQLSHREAGTAFTNYDLVIREGRTGFGVVAPAAIAHMDQASSVGAVPVLTLDQADVSEEFIRLIGTSAADASQSLVDAADMTIPGALAGWIKIYVQDDAASGAITDGVFFVPFYTAPTA